VKRTNPVSDVRGTSKGILGEKGFSEKKTVTRTGNKIDNAAIRIRAFVQKKTAPLARGVNTRTQQIRINPIFNFTG